MYEIKDRPNTPNKLLNAKEVQKILNCSESRAYQVIRDLNTELRGKGFYVINGRISQKYLSERFFGIQEG